MDFIGFLYGFGMLQGVILAAVLLLASSGHRLANGFMAGLILVLSLGLLQNWVVRTEFFMQHPGFALMIPPLDFAWGPLLYLYAFSLTTKSVSWKQAFHLLPAVLLLINSLNFFTYSIEEQRNFITYLWSDRTDLVLEQQVTDIAPFFWQTWVNLHLQGNLFALQFGIYCFLVLKQIKYHNQRLQQHFSSIEPMNLRWLQSLSLVCLVFLAIFLVFNRSQLILVGHFDVTALAPNIPYIFLVLLIYSIGTAAIFQPNIIWGVEAADHSEPTSIPSPVTETQSDPVEATEIPPSPNHEEASDTPKEITSVKYERSGLSLEDAESYKIELMKIMQDEELYLDCELTLPDLAERTGLTAHQVSQVINGQLNQNFFSFVNNYRIQLAKKLMSDPATSNMPIVELAVEVGFKSKSSFYEAFKKTTQMTPTQYKKSLVEPVTA
ncbi:AraC family transcriptional regulator [Maricurvus nonylphenolicus]|uniref:helix-turn-helix domain-containing protein n=1 Tax=Maricurvus nonylphenolicus TaxID=1008307 RepID=UPI0036F2BFF2